MRAFARSWTRIPFIAIALAVIGVPVPVVAQEVHRQQMTMPAGGPPRLPKGVTSFTIPFKRSGDHVLIPVGVNGSEPIWVVLDTGMPSPGILLYDGPRVAALKLEYSNIQAAVGGAGGSGGSTQARIALGATLEIGEAEIPGEHVTVLPRVGLLSAIHDGIIGMSVFANFVTAIDNDRGVIVLTDPKAYAPAADAAAVPLEMKGTTAYVDVGLVSTSGAVAPLRLILDLGASHAVSLNATSSKSIVVPDGALRTRIGRGMSGEVLGRVGRVAGLDLGGIRLPNVIATFPDSMYENPRGLDSRNGNLGNGVLSRFNVTFDYPHRKMYLVRDQRFADAFEWDMSGLVLEPGSGDSVSVAQVVAGSPAASAGIVAGDRLLAINGTPLTNRTMPDTRNVLRTDGAEVELQFVHDGAARTEKIKLRRMI
jgi:hypothetical protein